MADEHLQPSILLYYKPSRREIMIVSQTLKTIISYIQDVHLKCSYILIVVDTIRCKSC
jgi:hypothetical protein